MCNDVLQCFPSCPCLSFLFYTLSQFISFSLSSCFLCLPASSLTSFDVFSIHLHFLKYSIPSQASYPSLPCRLQLTCSRMAFAFSIASVQVALHYTMDTFFFPLGGKMFFGLVGVFLVGFFWLVCCCCLVGLGWVSFGKLHPPSSLT